MVQLTINTEAGPKQMHGFGYKPAELSAVEMHLQLPGVVIAELRYFLYKHLVYWNNLNIVYWNTYYGNIFKSEIVSSSDFVGFRKQW